MADLFARLSDPELVSMAKSGDMDAFMELVVRYVPVIRAKASCFFSFEVDDLSQEGLLGLLNAVKTYDPDAAAFRTYANVCITNRMISAVRKMNVEKAGDANVSLNAQPLAQEALLASSDLDPESLLIARERLELIWEQVNRSLSKMEWDVLLLRVSGGTYQKIANSLHISEKSVDNTMQRIRRKLKAIL